MPALAPACQSGATACLHPLGLARVMTGRLDERPPLPRSHLSSTAHTAPSPCQQIRMTIVRSVSASGDSPLLLISSFPPDSRVLELLRPLGRVGRHAQRSCPPWQPSSRWHSPGRAPSPVGLPSRWHALACCFGRLTARQHCCHPPQVRLVLAPNAAHCLWGAAMRDACPGALLAGPPNAAARFPHLRWDALVKTPAGGSHDLRCEVHGLHHECGLLCPHRHHTGLCPRCQTPSPPTVLDAHAARLAAHHAKGTHRTSVSTGSWAAGLFLCCRRPRAACAAGL